MKDVHTQPMYLINNTPLSINVAQVLLVNNDLCFLMLLTTNIGVMNDDHFTKERIRYGKFKKNMFQIASLQFSKEPRSCSGYLNKKL